MFTGDISSFNDALIKGMFFYLSKLFGNRLLIFIYSIQRLYGNNTFLQQAGAVIFESIFLSHSFCSFLKRYTYWYNFYSRIIFSQNLIVFFLFLGLPYIWYLDIFLIISNWAIEVTLKVNTKSCQIFSNSLARKNCEDNIFRYFI